MKNIKSLEKARICFKQKIGYIAVNKLKNINKGETSFVKELNITDKREEGGGFKNLPDPFRNIFFVNSSKGKSVNKKSILKKIKIADHFKTTNEVVKRQPTRNMRVNSTKHTLKEKSPVTRRKEKSSRLTPNLNRKSKKSKHFISNFFYKTNKKKRASRSIRKSTITKSHRQPSGVKEYTLPKVDCSLYKKILVLRNFKERNKEDKNPNIKQKSVLSFKNDRSRTNNYSYRSVNKGKGRKKKNSNNKIKSKDKKKCGSGIISFFEVGFQVAFELFKIENACFRRC